LRSLAENVKVNCSFLSQANLANVREFKQGMKDLHTDKIANFSAVLIKAFELLQQVRDTLLTKFVSWLITKYWSKILMDKVE
jgi:hypothetical protein